MYVVLKHHQQKSMPSTELKNFVVSIKLDIEQAVVTLQHSQVEWVLQKAPREVLVLFTPKITRKQ